MNFFKRHFYKRNISFMYKKLMIGVVGMTILFLIIGLLTTVAPAYRLSSEMISNWTKDIDSRTFLTLYRAESKMFSDAFPTETEMPKLSSALFGVLTNIKPDDPKSLLGNELPGFQSFGSKIIVAGEGTNYANLSIESSPPLEDVLDDREAVDDGGKEENDSEKPTKNEPKQTTGKQEPVFIYTTHNRESFLPHLPKSTTPNEAHHKDVNVTKVGDHFKKGLEKKGIGTKIDKSDIMTLLQKKNLDYGASYQVSRDIVKEAISNHDDIKYIFDIHRDSLPKDKTTKNIKGKDYGKIMFVVGAEHPNYEKNLKLATDLHYLIEKKHKGLSRGVIEKSGAGTNGVFNQDMSENAVLVEIGGYDNHLDEIYRSVDVLTEVFGDYFWDAEKVHYETDKE
ncbi:MAG TPA: stage II sporulation protein P [Candidatus Avamphibacillus intestinigallinarum]|nr:stage II sporulation protein P [Candidatus Avamphibacillus intestinigallinarum]